MEQFVDHPIIHLNHDQIEMFFIPSRTTQAAQSRHENSIETADIDQIRTMLTYCVRGERFCNGHWGAMIEDGHIRRLLQRLAEM